MIYLISDIHADKNFLGLNEYLQKATDEDWLIILGDIGFGFEKTEQNKAFDEFFLSIKKNVAFIDGNHENYDLLYSYPVVDFFGGKAYKLTDKIFMLERGGIYEMEGKKLFVMGGCKSSASWKERGLWSPKEEPSEIEVNYAKENLKKHNNKVDFVLTHKYEYDETLPVISQNLLELCRYIDESVEYKLWYSGHEHVIEKIDGKHFRIYNEIAEL